MVLSTLLQNHVVLFLSPQNLVVLSYSLQNRVAPYLLQNRMVYTFLLQSRVVYSFLTQNLVVLFPIYFGAEWSFSPFTLEPRGLLFPPPKPCGPPPLWLPRLGLNPSAHLPLQPHF